MATCLCRFRAVSTSNLNSKSVRIFRWIGITTRLIATSRDVLGVRTSTKEEDNTLGRGTATAITIGRATSEDVLKVMTITDHQEAATTMIISAHGAMKTTIIGRHGEAGAGPVTRKAIPKRRGGAGMNGNPTVHGSATKTTTIETAAVVVTTRRAGAADGVAIRKGTPKLPGGVGKNVDLPGAVRQTTMMIGGDPVPTKMKAEGGMEIPEVMRKLLVEVGTNANQVPAAGMMKMMTAGGDIKAMRVTVDGTVIREGIRKPPGVGGGVVIAK
jgi:hypothetical protein